MPEPRIGFLQEMLRWWDQWLKNKATGVTRDPDYRVYVMDADKPGSLQGPSARPLDRRFHLGLRQYGDQRNGILTAEWHCQERQATEKPLTISSRQTTGGDGGEYCIIWLGPEFPGDQKNDDAQSITFDSPALQTDMDIVGQPQVEIEFSVDKPVASVAVRLNDVWPTGEVSRITYHLQNLCMRDSRETPTALVPGKRYTMKIKLDDIAWRVPKDHKHAGCRFQPATSP